jgi:hypothetical protein
MCRLLFGGLGWPALPSWLAGHRAFLPGFQRLLCDGGPVEDAGLGLGDLGALVDA